jgi:erythromycin esterase-like protein
MMAERGRGVVLVGAARLDLALPPCCNSSPAAAHSSRRQRIGSSTSSGQVTSRQRADLSCWRTPISYRCGCRRLSAAPSQLISELLVSEPLRVAQQNRQRHEPSVSLSHSPWCRPSRDVAP